MCTLTVHYKIYRRIVKTSTVGTMLTMAHQIKIKEAQYRRHSSLAYCIIGLCNCTKEEN